MSELLSSIVADRIKAYGYRVAKGEEVMTVTYKAYGLANEALRGEVAKRNENADNATKHRIFCGSRKWSPANASAYREAVRWEALCRERERIARIELIDYCLSHPDNPTLTNANADGF